MNKEKSSPEDFIGEWLKNAKKDNPDSAIVQAVCAATSNNKLDETKLLGSLRETAKPTEEQKKP